MMRRFISRVENKYFKVHIYNFVIPKSGFRGGFGGGGGGSRGSGHPLSHMKNDVMHTVILHVTVLGFARLHIVLAKWGLYRSN